MGHLPRPSFNHSDVSPRSGINRLSWRRMPVQSQTGRTGWAVIRERKMPQCLTRVLSRPRWVWLSTGSWLQTVSPAMQMQIGSRGVEREGITPDRVRAAVRGITSTTLERSVELVERKNREGLYPASSDVLHRIWGLPNASPRLREQLQHWVQPGVVRLPGRCAREPFAARYDLT